MIGTVLITTGIALLAMLPGMLLVRGGITQTGQYAAAATASLVTMMLATALLGEISDAIGVGQLPSATIAPISLTAAFLAWWRTRNQPWRSEPVEWQGIALAAIFSAFGLFSMALALKSTGDGGLLIHGWYNADWFKHLGHVHALANYGVPARDIFGNGSRLYYYWLSYILPGAGAALGGDGWAALTTANSIITILFSLTFYAMARLACSSRNLALAVTFLGLFITAPPAFFVQIVFGPGLQAVLDMPMAPKGPALLAISQFIPQHGLAATMAMSWALMCRPDSTTTRDARILSLISFGSVMTVSILLGAMLLAAYGLTLIWRLRVKAAPELAAMAAFSGGLVLILGVLQLGSPDSALVSPLFLNQPPPSPWFIRSAEGIVSLLALVGLPLLAIIYVARFWNSEQEPDSFARHFSVSLILAAFILVFFTQAIMPPRIAIETLIRAVVPPGIGVAIIGAWALAAATRTNRSQLHLTWIAVTLMVIVALPCAYVRTVWMTRFGDLHTTLIPAQDLQVLSKLKALSSPREVVWQYPEPPLLAQPSGGDAWAAVLAGRTVDNSQRATDYGAILPFVEASERFFAGEPEVIPQHVSWVYLSRILHPDTYDILVSRMEADSEWHNRACYPDACLFSRAAAQ